VSANNEKKPNHVADGQVEVDLGDANSIAQSLNSEFDIIVMGEVFEHIFRPYKGLSALTEKLKPGGYLILTTPNLASIYNRLMLLIGNPLPNYRPIGSLPVEDHVTIVTKNQLVRLLKNRLNLKVLTVRGYTYAEKRTAGDVQIGKRFAKFRHLVNVALPDTFREGLIYFAQKPYNN